MQYLSVSLFFLLWVLWRTFGRLFTRSSLDNIRGPPARSLFSGSFHDVFNKNGWEYHRSLMNNYNGVALLDFGRGEKRLYISDPLALHHIIVKDQPNFQPAPVFTASALVSFGKGLLGTTGETHRKQRKMLNPVFSNAHMRDMMPIFDNIVSKLQRSLETLVRDGPQDIDLLHWTTRTALELVGQGGLGHSFDSLEVGSPIPEYTRVMKEFFPITFNLTFMRSYVFPWAHNLGPAWLRRAIVDAAAAVWPTLRTARDMVDIMTKTSVEILEEKRKALESGGEEAMKELTAHGKDIMSVLLKANMKSSAAERFDDDELLGQMSTLTFAAMDTTSSALARTFHLLSMYQDVQDKARKEILDAKDACGGNDLSFDELMELPYLDAICRETLRLYPPATHSPKCAQKDWPVPLHKPLIGRDGKEINEIIIPKGTVVHIAIFTANRNPDLWGPDSEEWKPERWLQRLPDAVSEAKVPGVYSHLMTFLGGARSCIGFKFSQMEMKIVLAMVLSTFKLEPAECADNILWEMIGVASPIVKGSNENKHQLPMRLTLLPKAQD